MIRKAIVAARHLPPRFRRWHRGQVLPVELCKMQETASVQVVVHLVLSETRSIIRATEDELEAEEYRRVYNSFYPDRPRHAEVLEKLVTV